jgi:HEAT repeat protein
MFGFGLWWRKRQLASRSREKQQQAVQAMGASGDVRAIPHLLDFCEERWKREVWIREAVEAALVKLGPAAVNRLLEELEQRETPEAVFAIVSALGKLGDPRAVPAILRYITGRGEKHAGWGWDIFEKALEALMGPDAFKSLVAALGRRCNPTTKSFLIRWLAQLKDERAVLPILRAAVQEPDKLWFDALYALRDHFAPLSTQLRVQAARNPDAAMRILAAELLAEQGDSRVFGPLLKALATADLDLRLRERVKVALGNLLSFGSPQDQVRLSPEYPKALRYLASVVKDRTIGIDDRSWALGLLRRTGEPAVIALLMRVYQCPDDPAREEAAGNLVWAFKEREEAGGKRPAAELARLVPLLLKDLRCGRKAWAARLLGWVDAPELVDPLLAVLREEESNDDWRRLQIAAGESLERILGWVAERVSTETLRTLAELPDLKPIERQITEADKAAFELWESQVGRDPNGELNQPYPGAGLWSGLPAVSNESLRQLARELLSRRGAGDSPQGPHAEGKGR